MSPADAERRHPARDDFERALKGREQRPEEPADESAEPAGNGGAPAWLAIAPTPMLARAATPAAASAVGVINEPSGTRAALEASLTASPGNALVPVLGTDPAALWEVSVREPNAAPLQVRVERSGTSDAQKAWGLTIASPASNVDLIARHAPRLNERLRKHAIELDHVRVERDDDPNAQ
ncbi:MAG TPA: hypothetical protein VML58_08190 [Burkholderiaceae bacterium]|nr:hypothetical protein [Burkholderiaceae bacterium]